MIKKEMREKVKEEEEEFKKQHTFPIERRANSCFQFNGKYQKYKILKEPDMRDAHLVFDHPTNAYKKFVKEQASNDF